MKKVFTRIITVFVLLGLAPQARAEADPKLFDGFWHNVGDSFTGTNLIFHAAGFASTSLLIQTGYDAHVYRTFRQSTNDAALGGAVLGTGVGALVTGSWLYYVGKSSEDKESLGAAFVIAQTALITVSYVALLKVTTGRAHPTNTWHLNPQEQSEQFQFGFFRAGITAYGWPSGHVSHTVAVTSALAHYYPKKPWLTWLSVGLSSYMLYSVSAHNSGQMHWFSDGVAGAFMGYAIGSTVGKNYRLRIDGSTNTASTATWLPVFGPNLVGAMVAVQF